MAALNQDTDPEVLATYKGPLFELHDHLLSASDREAFHAWIRANFNPLMAKTGGR